MATEQEEIWSHATGEQTENVPETPTEAPEPAKEERVRDDKGRFASANPEPISEEAPVEVQPETQPEVAPKEESDARVPSWRLAEEAERRRNAEQQLNELKNEFRQMQMQWMAQQRQPEPQTPQEAPDIFADPQAFVQNLQSTFDNRLKTLQLENSLRFAHYSHGDKFNEAYQDFTDHVAKTKDQATYQRVMASADPGEALVQWYNDQQLQKELGGSDLKTFLQQQQEKWMTDPQIQAKVIEAFKATQQAQPGNTINLPPSLSRASAAKSAHDTSGNSPQDVWAYANKR